MALASAKSEREGFLRRLEEQAQQKEQGGDPPVGDDAGDNEEAATEVAEAGNNAGTMKSPPEEGAEKTPADVKEKIVGFGGDEVLTKKADAPSLKSPPEEAKLNEEAKKPTTPTPTGDQLLLEYLSKFCDPVAGGPAASPENWIADVDAPSLAFLKGLAGVREDPPPSRSSSANVPLHSPNLASDPFSYNHPNSAASTNRSEGAVAAALYQEGHTKWEITVPPHGMPGEPFTVVAMGKKVRVLCPQNARAGQRVRFNLPDSVFEQPAEMQAVHPMGERPPGSVGVDYGRQGTLEATSATASFGDEGTAPPMKSEGGALIETEEEPKPKEQEKMADNSSESTAHQSTEQRMLSLIERQQRQLQELQARLDALGGMMATMDQNVRYLRDRQQFGQIQEWQRRQHSPRAEIGGYRIMGGLFGGARQPSSRGRAGQLGELHQSWSAGQQSGLPEAVPYQPRGAPPATQPGPPMQQPPAQPLPPPVPNQQPIPPPQQPAQQPPVPRALLAEGAPAPPQAVARPVAPVPRPPAPAAGEPPPLNQGIFFPIFAALFRFLFSLPGRLRAVLLSSGPGRVYAHLRERAIERRAFANVDLGSIMKLLVMLLIFAGRAGGRDGRERNNRRNRDVRDDAEDGMVAYALGLLRALIDFWNGHRVHTLVLASFVAFLIQVGLLSFFYQVLWVERAELWRAWLGQDPPAAEEDAAGTDAPAAEGQAGADAAADRAPARPNNGAARGRPGGAAAPAPAAQHGGLIRRGPNNGGVFHDIQCLLLSFLLSLIPAWRPEEAAREPEVQPEAGQPGAEQEPQQQPDPPQEGAEPPTGREGEDGDGNGNAAE